MPISGMQLAFRNCQPLSLLTWVNVHYHLVVAERALASIPVLTSYLLFGGLHRTVDKYWAVIICLELF